jgi:uncharacterized protein (DUF1800 family)
MNFIKGIVMKRLFPLIMSLFLIAIFGCSGSSESPIKTTDQKQETTQNPSSADPLEETADNNIQILTKPQTKNEASAFLSRATFGATQEEIDQLLSLEDYEKWFEEQFAYPATLHMAWAEKHAKGVNGTGDLKEHPEDWRNYSDALGNLQLDAWWDIVVHADDQLRQRLAFALSEIFVISNVGPLITYPDARISFYDTLVENAFSNFETLLQRVTYHPAMGKYLSYLGNAKAGMIGAHPDENYAREVMQLFSIGLYQLNDDGSYKVDQKGNPLHTYTQKDVTEMAKVFTGLSDANGMFPVEGSFDTHKGRTTPMEAFEEYHDKTQKKILGKTIPAGGTTKEDINKALHILFMHPNVAPFIGRQLIQRLVTSNPSAGYIQRVSAVFNDNGKGVRGDMKAVVKAILLDKEALQGAKLYPKTFGKFREPLLYISHLFRAFHAQNGEHILMQEDTPLYHYRSFNLQKTDFTQQQGPLSALTVFNYFTPDDAPYRLKRQNLLAPELTIYGKSGIDDLLMGLIHKNGFVYKLFEITAELQLNPLKKYIHNKQYNEAIDYLDKLLCAGTLSATSKTEIKKYLQSQHQTQEDALTRHLIGIVMVSPDYALQR